jgi:hypothetical protein
MARKQSRPQRRTVGRVMHEFKHGELTRGRGGKVRNPRQAIAIALSEAGASNRQSPAKNRQRLSQTKRKERAGRTGQAAAEGRSRRRRSNGPTRQELYQEATRRNVAGRSRMSKAELQRALRR